MTRNKANLSHAEVERLRQRPGTWRVSDNLYLVVGPAGNASWLFRYMRDHVAHGMGLGSADLFSLKEARVRALDLRKMLAEGGDPLEAKRSKKVADKLMAARSITFRECARRYIEARAPSWKNAKHVDQWRTTFFGSAKRPEPVTAAINDLPVSAIDTALALAVLEPIWQRTPETASRIRQRWPQSVCLARSSRHHAGGTGEAPAIPAFRGIAIRRVAGVHGGTSQHRLPAGASIGIHSLVGGTDRRSRRRHVG
jgi:hypothetical protein